MVDSECTDYLYSQGWHQFSLPHSVQQNNMSQLPGFPMALLQLREGATSGVALFLRRSYCQLLRSLTPTWRHGRSTTQQEHHPLDISMEPALHCWIRCTGLVGMMAALITTPFIDWTPPHLSGRSYNLWIRLMDQWERFGLEWSPSLKTDWLCLEAMVFPQIPFSLEQLILRIPSIMGCGWAMNFTSLTSEEVCELVSFVLF